MGQQSVLKALLKYRDFVARVEDESTHYVLPNHSLFQVAARLPVSRSELRDCLRTNWGPVQKYADEMVQLIKRKINSSSEKQEQRKKDQHVLFEDVPPATNPDAVAYHKRAATVLEPSDMRFTNSSLPTFDVKPKKVDDAAVADDVNGSVFSCLTVDSDTVGE